MRWVVGVTVGAAGGGGVAQREPAGYGLCHNILVWDWEYLRDPWLVLPGLSSDWFGLVTPEVPGAEVPVSCSSKVITPSMSVLILCSSKFSCLRGIS